MLNKLTEGKIYGKKDRQTDRQAERYAGRQTDGRLYQQTNGNSWFGFLGS